MRSCGSACEDVSDPSKTAGALAYSAMFDSLLWMTGCSDPPQLSGRDTTFSVSKCSGKIFNILEYNDIK